MSDNVLIRHCAPTLAGIKTGNMFSCPYKEKADVIEDIRRLNQKLVPRGLRVLPLRYLRGRVLIYVYRPSDLEADLSESSAREILRKAGYEDMGADRCVPELVRRLGEGEYFPHEIGLFLGYPPEDVQGFIENKGNGCKFAGCWKVYGDEEKARETFERYKQCTNTYFSQWMKGTDVERLTVA